jgi:hypothetical protein
MLLPNTLRAETKDGDAAWDVTQIADAYVTESALEAITAYRQACEEACEQVREVLRSLSGRIAQVRFLRQPRGTDSISPDAARLRVAQRLPEVINGIVFCTLAKTVVLHVEEASRKGWCIPELPSASPERTSESGAGRRDGEELAITDMIPYWMDPNVYTPRVVSNTVCAPSPWLGSGFLCRNDVYGVCCSWRSGA